MPRRDGRSKKMNPQDCPLTGIEAGQPGLDAVFYAGSGLGHSAPDWYPARRMATHLARCVLRNPNDLPSHSRRINFLLDHGEPLALAAAVADLFLVLGEREPRWRERLLAMIDRRVPADLLDYLRAPLGPPPTPLPDALFAHGPAYPGGADYSPRQDNPADRGTIPS